MNPLDLLYQARLHVGYLGERAQFDWWPTSFFGSSSEPFLTPVFSRTVLLARYRGVVEAARIAHDERLSVGTHHLFRLPEEIEQDLAAIALDHSARDKTPATLASQDTALDYLAGLTTGKMSSAEGPVAVGDISEIRHPGLADRLVAVYVQAFNSRRQAFPYLVVDRG